MSNVYTIENTAGTLAITLKPGSLNGFGSAQHDTDMRLYGMGALLWGEGVDENVLRLAENFACPAKELNDYNPATGNLDYDPDVDPIMPKDSTDLGAGKGIAKPIVGQTWFNTSAGQLYVYSQISTSPDTYMWRSTGGVTLAPDGESPATPNDGDMWYDETEDQLKIYTDGAWSSVADRYLLLDGTVTMTGDIDMTSVGSPAGSFSVINLRDPVDPQDAATKNYVDVEVGNILYGGALDGLYLRRSGGVMDSTAHITFGFGHLVLNASSGGDVSSGADMYASAQMLLACDNHMYFHIDGDGLNSGDFVVSKGSVAVGSGETNLFRIHNNGQIRSGLSNYETLITHDDVLTNKRYVDQGIAAAFADPSVPKINPSSPKDGDVRVDAGPVIYIYGGGSWNKVFPAVYTA